MAGTIQIDYDRMQNLCNAMETYGQQIKDLLNKTKAQIGNLRDGKQWEGAAADKFFNEMDDTVLPALARLEDALGSGAVIAREIVATIRQADEETQGYFNNLGL
jgi:WXG100 family type VII secretion target